MTIGECYAYDGARTSLMWEWTGLLEIGKAASGVWLLKLLIREEEGLKDEIRKDSG